MQTEKTWTLFDAESPAGSRVLRSFLISPPADIRLDILVHSEKKLLSEFPILKDGARDVDMSVRILEGDATDATMLDACLKDSQVIILPCEPAAEDCISRERHAELARAIISALRRLRQQKKSNALDAAATITTTVPAATEPATTAAYVPYQPPSVIQLRSSVQQRPASSSAVGTLPPQDARWLPKMIHRIATFRRSHGSSGGGNSIGSGRRSGRAERIFTKAAAERSEKGQAALMRHTSVDLSPGVDCEPRGKRRSSLRSKFSRGRKQKQQGEVTEDSESEATTLLGDDFPLAKKSFYSRLLRRGNKRNSAATLSDFGGGEFPKDHRWSVLVDDHVHVPAKPKTVPITTPTPSTMPASMEKTAIDSDCKELNPKSLSRKWIPCLLAGMCYVGMAIGAMPVAIPEQLNPQVY